MDIVSQIKLSKSEWDSIEVPVSEQETKILELIVAGYHDVNIKVNNTVSLFTFLKIEFSEKMEDYLYNVYLRATVLELIKDYKITYIKIEVDPKIQIKSADKIRLERNDPTKLKDQDLYEFVLLATLKNVFRNIVNKDLFTLHLFTLYKLMRNNVTKVNRHIVAIANRVLLEYRDDLNLYSVVINAVRYIERNPSLLKYADLTLYEHQKQIFTTFKSPQPKLVFYIAPTGTGKTISPLALAEQKKVIFVCAARHVGLALAKAAISVKKKVAFAFGCSSADDIRLHYYAAKVFTRNRRTGGIGKVDNSVGTEVEIMICDIKSYLPAMYYMLAFNSNDDLILYWDEPTITMDYPEHELHSIIRRNWKNNLIPQVVMSSATLPKPHELTETIADFKNRFDNAEICNIVSHDSKKSIPLVNTDGFAVLPHHLTPDYAGVVEMARYCLNNMTLLRYCDLEEIVEFIAYVTKHGLVDLSAQFARYFENPSDITMTSIKTYYLVLLQNVTEGSWPQIFNHFSATRKHKIPLNVGIDPKGNRLPKSAANGANPGVFVTTRDSFTLTDGPTIFISDDVEKIATFYIQQANIPVAVMADLMAKIEHNNVLNKKLDTLEKEQDEINQKFEESVTNSFGSKGGSATRVKSCKTIKKFNRDGEATDGKKNKTKEPDSSKSDTMRIKTESDALRALLKPATLNETFIPNKALHLNKWASDLDTTSSFTSDIKESTLNEIMLLHEVDDSWKILLMMGIGVFTHHKNIRYREIMKTLADQQQLFMLMASSDYIYGTNYQFSHGYLGKDLNLTQEKIIQAMGRVGRGNLQQNYSIRFRDNAQILKLFTNETDKPEIINMNICYNSKKVVWDGANYVEQPEDEEEDVVEAFAIAGDDGVSESDDEEEEEES
jgi:hypothetical protein